MWETGETVVHHEVWRDRVWAARPLVVAEDSADQLLLWIPKGTVRNVPATPGHRPDPGTRAGRVIENLAAGDWDYAEHVWDVSTLCILRPHDWHAIWVSWRDDGDHYGWYVNLQRPFRRTAAGIEAMDLMLDVVVEPDLSWRWKDDDEFDEILARGIFDPAVGRRVREEAAAVVDRIEENLSPFCDGWPRWRPDAAWQTPVLPEQWDQVPDEERE